MNAIQQSKGREATAAITIQTAKAYRVGGFLWRVTMAQHSASGLPTCANGSWAARLQRVAERQRDCASTDRLRKRHSTRKSLTLPQTFAQAESWLIRDGRR